MNKVIDAMLAEVSPEMLSVATDFLSEIGSAIQANALLPAEIRDELPLIGVTEGEDDPMAVIKFFTPDGQWTWYVVQFDGNDTFFGLVKGLETEMGYFSLSELQEIRGHLGLPVERDLSFEPTRLSKLR